jgi:hypothetical protein
MQEISTHILKIIYTTTYRNCTIGTSKIAELVVAGVTIAGH